MYATAAAPPDRSSSASVSAATAAAIASCAYAVPLLLSISSSPSPNHPRIFLWYKSLRKPSIQPPDVLFPIAWTAIETCLAVSGYRLLRAAASAARRNALAWWSCNLFLIGGWSRFFFKTRNLALSTVAAAGLVATSAAFVHRANKVDRTAAGLGLPLLGWATFATILTATIWRLNSPRWRAPLQQAGR
jgi:benzodiazapine receptor